MFFLNVFCSLGDSLSSCPSLPLFHSATQSDFNSMSAERFRIFRAEKTYRVNAGKWYFELEVSWNE